MPESTNPQFNLVVPITGYTIRKDAKGVEKYVLTGLASNTDIDLTGERMAKSAITAMAKSLETNKVYLNNEHGSDWDDDFGEVTKLWPTDNYELMMEAELDPDHYRTKTLIKALDKGKKLGLSIGGYVLDAAKEFVDEVGAMVMTYKDISLFHVAITGTPAVAETWVTPITKSVKDWKETPMPKTETQVEKTEEQVEQVEETVETPETPETVEEAPAAETPAETPEEEAEETPAESEAPETESTEKSTEEAPAESEETPETDTDAPEADAAAQEEEAPASAESAPEQAEGEEADVEKSVTADEAVAKSTVFGDWAAIDLTTSAIDSLSWQLQDHVWMTLIDSDKSADEKLAAIADGLDDFKSLVLKVAGALVDDSNADAVKSAAEAHKESAPDAVSKSLDEKDAQVKALTKSLADTEVKLEAAQTELSEKTSELEKTTKSLGDTTDELDKVKARKAIVFNKFGTEEVIGTPENAADAYNQAFAQFVVNGK